MNSVSVELEIDRFSNIVAVDSFISAANHIAFSNIECYTDYVVLQK